MIAITKPQKELDGSTTELIGNAASRLLGMAGITRDDLPDVKQDLTIAVLESLHRFNPRRARFDAFVCMILVSKSVSILRRRTAGKRGSGRRNGSLNRLIVTDDGHVSELAEVSPVCGCRNSECRCSQEARERLDLAIDLGEVLASLPEDLRQLCEKLREHSLSSSARQLGISWGRARGMVKRLRVIFERAGLADYLQNREPAPADFA